MVKPRQYKKETLYKIYTTDEYRWNNLVKEYKDGLDLSGSVFHGMNLERRYTKKVNFDNCQFYNCCLHNVEFFSCSFQQASFLNCSLEYADFATSNLYRVGISNLTRADNVSFYLANLNHSVIVGTSFTE